MASSKFDLTGKVGLITGGAGLLGEQHAMALGECGAKVILADIDEQRAIEKATFLNQRLGLECVSGLQMDVTNAESVESVHRKIIDRFGGVGILVNNAAIDAKVSAKQGMGGFRIENFNIDMWNLHFSVGLTGAFLCSKTFGHWMATHGGGVILNIASDLSVIAPDQRLYRLEGVTEENQPVKPITYSVIKTAIVGLTRYLAAYWAKHGVRVNALSPGGVYTDQPVSFLQRLESLIPLERMAKVDEYQAAVQFLCSDASSYMTGQNLVIDGGRTIL